MLIFPSNTSCLEYQKGAYLCNHKVLVEGPLDLDTLQEAVCQCPKLKEVYLDDAPFGDECFPVFAQLSQLTTLALLRGGQIKGHGLALLKDLPVKTLFLQRTALDDEGLSQAARISKLTDIYIAACPQVTFQGLMAISWRDKLVVHDMDNFDEKGRTGLFTQEQKKLFEDARAYKNMKNRLPLDRPELEGPIAALRDFFKEMSHWESLAAIKGLDDPNVRAEIDQLFSRRVSWKPRPGWRPVSLSFQADGTYQGCPPDCGREGRKEQILALCGGAYLLLSFSYAACRGSVDDRQCPMLLQWQVAVLRALICIFQEKRTLFDLIFDSSVQVTGLFLFSEK